MPCSMAARLGFLQRAIGAPRARALALLGESLISAKPAALWGLIWTLVEDDELFGRGRCDGGERCRRAPPPRCGLIKAQLEFGSTAPFSDALD